MFHYKTSILEKKVNCKQNNFLKIVEHHTFYMYYSDQAKTNFNIYYFN